LLSPFTFFALSPNSYTQKIAESAKTRLKISAFDIVFLFHSCYDLLSK